MRLGAKLEQHRLRQPRFVFATIFGVVVGVIAHLCMGNVSQVNLPF